MKRKIRHENIRTSADNSLGKSDIPMTAAVIALVAFGVLMVYSAGSYTASRIYGNEYYYVIKQLTGAGLGLAAMFLFSRIDYHVLYKLRYVILAVSLVQI